MTLPVVWMSEATRELMDARSWYSTIRPELGERFEQAVVATVQAVVEYPAQFAVVYRGLRRAGVRRFPYGLIFEIQERRILVLACFHGRRDPQRWRSRSSG